MIIIPSLVISVVLSVVVLLVVIVDCSVEGLCESEVVLVTVMLATDSTAATSL